MVNIATTVTTILTLKVSRKEQEVKRVYLKIIKKWLLYKNIRGNDCQYMQ
jgi:hypothetical protein